MRKLFFTPFLILPNIATAADTGISNSDTLPTIVVSPSRIEQPIHEVGASVTVLYADELMERGISFVSDAFREAPSLNLITQGPRGSKNQVRIRGNEANHVLVLMDGVRINDASSGEFDFANMHLAGIERIEILHGPQSTMYGTDAAAGVINIITRKGTDGFKGEVDVSAGSLDSQSGSVQLFGGKDGWHYAFSADRFITDGISAAAEENGNTEKDGHDSKGIKFKAGYDADNYKTWVLYNQSSSNYDFDDTDSITGLAVDALTNTQLIETENASWVIAFPMLDKRLSNQFQVSSVQYDFNSESVFFNAPSTFITQTDRSSAEYQGNYKLDENQSLQFGLEYVKDDLQVDSISTFGTSTFDEDTSTTDLYMQWSGKLNNTNLTLGSRSSDHKEFGRHNTVRATVSQPLDTNWRLRSTYGTGFKTPSLQELFDSNFGGNPNLKPEETSSIELGLDYQSANYQSSITLFDQSTTNMIRYIGSFPTGQLENVDAADSRGIELTNRYFWQQAELMAAISWTDATETASGVKTERYRVPELAGQITASYMMSNYRFSGEALYQGDRRDLNFYANEDVNLDAYWLFNVAMSYELNREIRLTARIDNLFDENYEEIFSYGTLGRTGTLSLNWRF